MNGRELFGDALESAVDAQKQATVRWPVEVITLLD